MASEGLNPKRCVWAVVGTPYLELGGGDNYDILIEEELLKICLWVN